jgi:para-nitrobenzyl esterase
MMATTSRRTFLQQASLAVAAAHLGPWARLGAQTSDVIAETAYGRVRGTAVGDIKIFKGVPYGASTAGRNRFMPPVKPAAWTGVRDALAYGPSTPQTVPGPNVRLAKTASC